MKSKQLSFYSLYTEENYQIKIPRIQRDYAHGRTSAEEVRSGFLDALYTYLQEGKPKRDLDFIYGDVEQGALAPLDGQQRLTTLFLLHWYLALKEGNYNEFKEILLDGNHSKFTYEIRQSSKDFCNALLSNGIDLTQLQPANKNKENALSKTIRDSYWYFQSWEKDPTVQSMLRMLDAIYYKFKNTNGFYAKLIDSDNPVITFQFLALEDYGLTEDLYIKMNSRGKPLTWFENFKAKFEKHLSQEPYNTYRHLLTYRNEQSSKVDTKEYFSYKIDTEWTDLFWSFKTKKEKNIDGELVVDYEIDDLMTNFISVIAINHAALNQKDIAVFVTQKIAIPFKFYLDLNPEFAINLIKVLDILSAVPTLNTFLTDFHYFDEKKAFRDIIHGFNDAGYRERILYFAYYSFLIKNNRESDGLQDWMRIITNLSENTAPYNKPIEYANAISAIYNLLPYSKNILAHAKGNEFLKLKGFNPYQVKEESIKAYLIAKSEEWKSKIIEFEAQSYFKGQLTFALFFSGIEEHFNKHSDCNWSTDENKTYLEDFENYISKVFALFTDSGLNKEALKKHQLHRAILSKGDYLVFAKQNYSFLNDSDRDVSWKRFLLGDGERYEKRKFFKQVIDDQLFTANNLDSLNEIALQYHDDIEQWRKSFICTPEVFNYMGNFKYIRYFNDDMIYLVWGQKISGKHAELFSVDLYIQLKKDKLFNPPTPFNELGYFSPSRLRSKPCAFLDGWFYQEQNFALDIYYNCKPNQKYTLRFFDRNGKGFSTEIVRCLTQNGFSKKDASYEILQKESELRGSIVKLCASLNKIL